MSVFSPSQLVRWNTWNTSTESICCRVFDGDGCPSVKRSVAQAADISIGTDGDGLKTQKRRSGAGSVSRYIKGNIWSIIASDSLRVHTTWGTPGWIGILGAIRWRTVDSGSFGKEVFWCFFFLLLNWFFFFFTSNKLFRFCLSFLGSLGCGVYRSSFLRSLVSRQWMKWCF